MTGDEMKHAVSSQTWMRMGLLLYKDYEQKLLLSLASVNVGGKDFFFSLSESFLERIERLGRKKGPGAKRNMSQSFQQDLTLTGVFIFEHKMNAEY